MEICDVDWASGRVVRICDQADDEAARLAGAAALMAALRKRFERESAAALQLVALELGWTPQGIERAQGFYPMRRMG